MDSTGKPSGEEGSRLSYDFPEQEDSNTEVPSQSTGKTVKGHRVRKAEEQVNFLLNGDRESGSIDGSTSLGQRRIVGFHAYEQLRQVRRAHMFCLLHQKKHWQKVLDYTTGKTHKQPVVPFRIFYRNRKGQKSYVIAESQLLESPSEKKKYLRRRLGNIFSAYASSSSSSSPSSDELKRLQQTYRRQKQSFIQEHDPKLLHDVPPVPCPLRYALKMNTESGIHQSVSGFQLEHKKKAEESVDPALYVRFRDLEEACCQLLTESPVSEASVREWSSRADFVQKQLQVLVDQTEGTGSGGYERRRLNQLLLSINECRQILMHRLQNTPHSQVNQLKVKVLYLGVACNEIRKYLQKNTSPSARQCYEDLYSQREALIREQSTASSTRPVSRQAIKSLGSHLEYLAKKLTKAGVKVSKSDMKHAVSKELGTREWPVLEKPMLLTAGSRMCRLQQRIVPACQLQCPVFGSVERKKEDIFAKSYQGKGVTSHASDNIHHATNLQVSELKDRETGNTWLSVIRHGVHSPYGHEKHSESRHSGAVNRAKEAVTAALAMKPELIRQALQGKTVDLLMTSVSLLTPDKLRQMMDKKMDERPMLEDQLMAYKQLSKQQPLPLIITLPDGNKATVSVNLTLLPFNMGVNGYAIDALSDAVVGWNLSDQVNKNSLQQLVGSLDVNDPIGGLAGDFLSRYEDHPDSEPIIALVQQIREIFTSKAHHKGKGGAYKLSARLIVLSQLIGAVPATNCKSGKDRTSMSVVTAEALIAYIRQYNKVPDWRQLTDVDKHMVRELALQGSHHRIQEWNTGAPGFKIQRKILQAYVKDEASQDCIQGLSDAVSG
ncbi:Inositol phosphate phosphatase IpgD [invertebrate metagenome]|uniref:Inositol phosphate phosphatase IpgD n=1 Tax=invertebrate metagenome TaxID=1711999 RepID=A0A2H9TA20_9ZZZZ